MPKLIPKFQRGQVVPRLTTPKFPFLENITNTRIEKPPVSTKPATIKNVLRITDYSPLPFSGSIIGVKNLPKIKGLDSRVNPEHLRDMLFEVSADTRLNKYQKAVILAHMGVESLFNPFQQQVGGPAYGPMQFEAERQQEFKDYIKKYGDNSRAVVDYLVDTMVLKPDTTKHWRYFGDKYPRAMDSYNSFKDAKNLQEALESSYYGYVRPKSSQNPDSAKVELLKRLDLAQQFLKYVD